MKPLLPTLKEKKRYISYEILSEDSVSHSAIIGKVKEILGVLGSARAGLQLIKRRSSRGVLRCSLAAYPDVRSALLIINKVGMSNIMIKTIRVSGILKKCEVD